MPVMSFVLGCNDFFKKYKSVELGNQLANICNAKIHVLFHFGTLFLTIWISTGVRKGIQISNGIVYKSILSCCNVCIVIPPLYHHGDDQSWWIGWYQWTISAKVQVEGSSTLDTRQPLHINADYPVMSFVLVCNK